MTSASPDRAAAFLPDAKGAAAPPAPLPPGSRAGRPAPGAPVLGAGHPQTGETAEGAVSPAPADASIGGDGASAGARTWVLELPAGMKLLSLNGRVHWSEQRRRAYWLKEAAWAVAKRAKVPPLGRVSIVIEYQPPDRRHRDADNVGAASGKHAIDGLVAAKVIEDDESPRYVTGIQYVMGPVHPGGRLVLHITQAEALP